MDKKNIPDFGRVMNDALQDALRSGDFSGLRRTVNTTVQSVVSKTIECAKEARDDAAYLFDWDKKPKTPPPGWGPCAWNPGRVWEPGQEQPEPPEAPERQGAPATSQQAKTPPQKAQRPRQTPPPPPRTNAYNTAQPKSATEKISIIVPSYLKKTTRDMVAGVFLIIAGLLLLLPSGIMALFFVLNLFLSGVDAFSIALIVVMLMIAAPGAVLVRKGFVKFGRAKRFRQYWALLREQGYCEISVLAGAIEKKPRFVLKDITRMLNAGLFPKGRLDEEKTCLILGDELYRQYQASREGKKLREQESPGNNTVIAAGMEAVRQIRAANAALPGAVISEKLFRLEDVTTGIFAYVEQRPEKLPEIRRFIDYYLPTTVKLVKSYQEFESQPETASTAAAKEEILATLDTISTAFESLLDGLYQDDTMDISTDISVLKTMLAQEGLTESDFEKKRSADHE